MSWANYWPPPATTNVAVSAGNMLRLDPPIPLDTPKGPGWAYFVIDRSQDHDLEWVCFIAQTGECWTYRNRDIRLRPNETMGIRQACNA
jgi:hypothetical protein